MLTSKINNTMSKINIFCISLLVAATATSCSQDLLNLSPEMSNVSNNFFQNEEQLTLGVTGAYATLQLDGQYQISNLILGELPSDNTWDEVPANDGGNCGQVDLFNMDSSNSIVEDSWTDNYVGIQQCNLVLNRVNSVPDLSEETINTTIAEMKFLRGLMYFNLVRIFGGVQIVLDETSDPSSYFGQVRNSVDEVYVQILSDLEASIDDLPESASQVGRATKYAAYGVLARVYLTLGDYTSAHTALKKIESSNKYALLSDVNNIFDLSNENSEEIIFDVQFASGLNGNSEGSDAYRYFSPSSVSGGKGHNLPTTDVYALYEDGDARKAAYFYFPDPSNTNVIATNKIKAPTSGTDSDGGSNTVVVRYADVLLMIAECEAQAGDLTAGNDYLERVRVRANASHTDLTSKDALLAAIATERRKELISEGHRWFDLIRTGDAISVMNSYLSSTAGYAGIAVTTNNLIQPIPLAQIDADASTVQNPGYN